MCKNMVDSEMKKKNKKKKKKYSRNNMKIAIYNVCLLLNQKETHGQTLAIVRPTVSVLKSS